MGTLTDAGSLFAMIDRGQEAHSACVEALPHLEAPLLTTWPCLAEAMYLLGTRLRWKGQERLWQYIEEGGVVVHDLTSAERRRMKLLMEKYRDLPMDFADASLVAVAESLRTKRIFTIDGDFRIYRLNDKESFEVVP